MKSKLLIALTTAFISMGAMQSTTANAGDWGTDSGWHGGWGGGHHSAWGQTKKYLLSQDDFPTIVKCTYGYKETFYNNAFGRTLYIITYQPAGSSCKRVL